MTSQEVIKILIAEDQPILLQALTTLLANETGIEVVAGAVDGEQAIALARAYRPDVVLMDLQMPRLDGVGATRRILKERPDTIVIVLTTFCTDNMIFDAIEAGARSYLLKDAEPTKIAEVVRTAVRGESHLSPNVARRLMEECKRIRAPGFKRELIHVGSLTNLEVKILSMVVEGKSNAEIASALALAEGTVKNYVSAILDKFHAKNRTELAMKAIGHHEL